MILEVRGPDDRLLGSMRVLDTDEMSEWQPIETAPKDGTTIDVWVGRRLTDVCWHRLDLEIEYLCWPTDSVGWGALVRYIRRMGPRRSNYYALAAATRAT